MFGRVAFLAVAMVVVLGVPAARMVAAGEPPLLPHYFYGIVRIDNVDAPAGTSIEARGPGVVRGPFNPIVTTEPGKYGSANPAASAPRLLVQGDVAGGAVIEFFVNGLKANQTAAFRSGGVQALDLTVGTAAIVAETSLAQRADADGTVVLPVVINRIKDRATGATAQIAGGVGGYTATATPGATGGIELVAVRESPPYLAPVIDLETGTFGVSSVAAPEQPSNSTVGKLVVRLTGPAGTACTLDVAFTGITQAAGGPNVPEEQANSLAFRRGDATGDGRVDIFDAMFIAQAIVGNRSWTQIALLNAASVKHDGAGGDRVDIFDAMFIGQFVVGWRNSLFQ